MSLLAAGHQVRALVRPGADGARLEAAGAELASGSLSANVARCFDLARARRDLGYDPVIAAQEGMAGLVAWYRAEGLLDAVD